MAVDGGKGVAIVAIPSQEDYVWRISSEKVPHLTLLFLGDQVQNFGRVRDFLGHAIDTSLQRFWMDVDRRGVLGDKSADVLFFHKDGMTKRLEEFRRYLLTDPDILRAYNSTEQFPEWQPHLTLGYPETPAKPDKRDYPGLGLVSFDRIGLWTGDYTGVVYTLKSDRDWEIAMSAQKGKNFLQHYGVKGMKWGVIRDRASKAHRVVKSPDAQKAERVRSKAKVIGVNSLSNKELQDVITRMNLEMQYSNLKRVEHEQSLLGKGTKWAGNFINDVAKDAASSWIKRPGSNFSGRTSARTSQYAWDYGHQVAGAISGGNQRAIGR